MGSQGIDVQAKLSRMHELTAGLGRIAVPAAAQVLVDQPSVEEDALHQQCARKHVRRETYRDHCLEKS